MNSRSLIAALVAGITSCAIVPQATAATIVADTVLDYFDSGTGPMAGPYGGTFPGTYPVAVPLSYATDGNESTFVSLPTRSFLTLGFGTGYVFDGPGLDLFVSEVGGASETADVFISSDFGGTFTFLGVATTATVSGFDFASIGYTSNVNAVKVVGLDAFGGSPGFDLAFVKGLEGSSVVIPEPATMALLSLGLLGIAASARRRKS
ncbi:MAG: PEP-CTERM sorting domain-containing protein [Candidatus Accumulibacter meliphilus]|uniref:PEP-CTERM sorting domain-containing protein n=1 Tax=Candidatus Accumulibacter meliphilus TaxID=2211374 RepID=UPI002FC2E406